MNVGMMCLTMNLIIISWPYFHISFSLETFTSLLPFISVLISWLMCLIYYIIFITYKIKNLEKRFVSALSYTFTYIIFIILIISLALAEQYEHNSSFFFIYEKVLGISSAILNGIVYIPQIYSLLKTQSAGSVSLLMYALQTPGNIFILIFQAILAQNPITTWITYLLVLIEQSIILFLLILFKLREKEHNTQDLEEYIA